MTDLESDLREAYEARDFAVASVSVNRRTVRVALLDEDVDSEVVRSIATETVGEDALRGLNVATEAIDGRDQMGTVVSFRVG